MASRTSEVRKQGADVLVPYILDLCVCDLLAVIVLPDAIAAGNTPLISR